jgi:hypothetical protein
LVLQKCPRTTVLHNTHCGDCCMISIKNGSLIMMHWTFWSLCPFVGILRNGNGHLIYRRLRSIVSLHHSSSFLANCQTFRHLVQTLSSYRPSQNKTNKKKPQKHAFLSLSLSRDTRRVSHDQTDKTF